MTCTICGDHEDLEKCKKCKNCEREHFMKWGKNMEAPKSEEKCPHFCRFQLPNKQWVNYPCIKINNHNLACDFNVNKKVLERMARDSVGGR